MAAGGYNHQSTAGNGGRPGLQGFFVFLFFFVKEITEDVNVADRLQKRKRSEGTRTRTRRRRTKRIQSKKKKKKPKQTKKPKRTDLVAFTKQFGGRGVRG